jgi:3-oxoadipate enol-lactonase
MPFAHRGSISLYYQAIGAGLPILFLHGFTSSHEMWRGPVKTLSASYQCLCMDLRGHGQSSVSQRSAYTLAAMADDALSVLNQQDVERAVVIGHSLGGMIAQHLAVHHQNRLAALVLSSTTCMAPPRDRFEPLIEGAIALARIPADDRATNSALQHSSPLDEDTAWGCGEAVMTLPRYDEQLAGVALPVLAIYGEKDSDTIINGSQQLVSAIPDCGESIVLDAGHVPQITHTEAYTEAVQDFLKNIELTD